jgi:hypothetical protein
MTVARSLAEFLTQVSYADLPPQTVEHAAMLIASTIASAAWPSPGSTAGRPKPRSGLTRALSCRLPMPHGSTPS